MAASPSTRRAPTGFRRLLTQVRRRVLLRRRALAALCAALAALFAVQAVRSSGPSVAEVVVAAHDLPAGHTLTADDVRVAQLPASAVPVGALNDPTGGVLASPLRRGEAVTDVRLVSPALARAQPGGTALPVRLPDAGVAGLLRPGDEVDLLATDPEDGSVRTVATGVRVLAVPSDVSDGPAGGGSGALVVLEVTGPQAISVTSASLVEFLSVTM